MKRLFFILGLMVLVNSNISADIIWTGNGEANQLFDKNNWKNKQSGTVPQSIVSGTPINDNVYIGQDYKIGTDREIKGIFDAGTGKIEMQGCVLRTDYGTLSAITSQVSISLDGAMLLTGSVSAPIITLKGKSELHLFEEINPISNNTLIDLQDEDSWLFFLTISPENAKKYLDKITINGQTAIVGQNVRLCNYYGGSVIIPHGIKQYTALYMYSEENQTGTAKKFLGDGVRKFGTNQIGENKSFLLKRGYMAVLADNPSGTGNSKTYVADDADLEINMELNGKDNKVMSLRVLPWQWICKQGVAWGSNINLFNVTWYYNWDAKANSQATNTDESLSYVAMRHGKDWASLNGLATNLNITHCLGFNEPERTDQAKMTVKEALDRWYMLESTGTLLGSPCPANSNEGKKWLTEFMDSCIVRGYRVDYITLHNYEKYDANYFVNTWCKYWYDKYKLPIWVTEFNYGETWNTAGTENPNDYHKGFVSYVEALDKAPHIQRYAFFTSGVVNSEKKKLYCGFESSNPTYLTRRGIFYREFESRPERGNPILYRKPIIETKASENSSGGDTSSMDGKCFTLLSRNTDGTQKRRVDVIVGNNEKDYAKMGGSMATATATQQYRFVQVASKRFKLLSNDCKALTLVNDTVCAIAENTSDYQVWQLDSIEGTNYVVLKNIGSGEYLYPFGGKINLGTHLTTEFTAEEISSKTKAHWEIQAASSCGCFTDDQVKIIIPKTKGEAPFTLNFSGSKKNIENKDAYYVWSSKVSDTDSIYTTNYTDSIIYTQPGTYKLNVRVRDYYGIDETLEYTIVVEEPGSGISEVETEKVFQVYPNPTKDYINISGVHDMNAKIDVYNISGVKVLSEKVKDRISIANLPAGIYFGHVDGYKVHKIIKN